MFQPSQQHPLEMFLDRTTPAMMMGSFTGTNLLNTELGGLFLKAGESLPRERGDIWV